jgi:putative ABC transport system permease protein
MVQFLIEAAVISFIGGLFGVLIGVGGTLLATALTKLPPAVMWNAVGGAVVLSAAVGLVFGLQPAWRAANVDPIQALRS